MALSFTITQDTSDLLFSVTEQPFELSFTIQEGVGPAGEDGANGVTISITPPVDPVDGQHWYDPEDAVMSFWTGSEWVTEEVAITSGETSAFANALIFA